MRHRTTWIAGGVPAAIDAVGLGTGPAAAGAVMSRQTVLVGLGLAAVLTAGACTTGTGPATGPAPSGPASTGAAPAGSSSLIPQPTPPADLPLAPESKRVDIARPTFSNPTKITNPLFPISAQNAVVHLGTVDGRPLRTEVTTLPYTRIIEWDGQRIETVVSRYVLFADGRIKESAIDWYAQSDDGAVWYFGEDVANYSDGVVTDTGGTWITGKDGPAAMIMSGKPAVGQVWRPENIPGLVFEEVSVTAVDQTVPGPRGPISGAMVSREIHKDGTMSDKIFSPGYGESRTGSATELEVVELVVPVDALPGPVRAELATVATSAGAIFDAAMATDWTAAATQLDSLRTAWTAVRGGDVPAQIRTLLDGGLTALTTAVGARDQAGAGQAAIDTLRLGLDLQLRHRPAPEVELARMDVWGRQLLLDATAADPAGAVGDVVAVKYIRDRVLRAVDRADIAKIDALIAALEDATGAPDFPAVTAAATTLRETVAAARPAR